MLLSIAIWVLLVPIVFALAAFGALLLRIARYFHRRSLWSWAVRNNHPNYPHPSFW